MQRVAVHGAGLPVLDLDEAGAFGRAAVLQRLRGRRRALRRRLRKSTSTHESLLQAFVPSLSDES